MKLCCSPMLVVFMGESAVVFGVWLGLVFSCSASVLPVVFSFESKYVSQRCGRYGQNLGVGRQTCQGYRLGEFVTESRRGAQASTRLLQKFVGSEITFGRVTSWSELWLPILQRSRRPRRCLQGYARDTQTTYGTKHEGAPSLLYIPGC